MKLHRCPRCGSRVREYIDYEKKINGRFPFVVRCSMCGLSTEKCNTESQAVDAWNNIFFDKQFTGRQMKLF